MDNDFILNPFTRFSQHYYHSVAHSCLRASVYYCDWRWVSVNLEAVGGTCGRL